MYILSNNAAADQGGGARGPSPPCTVSIGPKQMAAECGSLFIFHVSWHPLSEVSGSATDVPQLGKITSEVELHKPKTLLLDMYIFRAQNL